MRPEMEMRPTGVLKSETLLFFPLIRVEMSENGLAVGVQVQNHIKPRAHGVAPGNCVHNLPVLDNGLPAVFIIGGGNDDIDGGGDNRD